MGSRDTNRDGTLKESLYQMFDRPAITEFMSFHVDRELAELSLEETAWNVFEIEAVFQGLSYSRMQTNTIHILNHLHAPLHSVRAHHQPLPTLL